MFMISTFLFLFLSLSPLEMKGENLINNIQNPDASSVGPQSSIVTASSASHSISSLPLLQPYPLGGFIKLLVFISSYYPLTHIRFSNG